MFGILTKNINVWRAYRNLKPLRKEFLVYCKNDNSNEQELIQLSKKGVAFLDYFIQTYDEIVKEYNYSSNLDQVYGDLSEILFALMDVTSQYGSIISCIDSDFTGMITKSLQVIELILRDPKYYHIMINTNAYLESLVELLDKVRGSNNLKILLQAISNLGISVSDKLEIGKLNGFRKMFSLLVRADDILATEILKSLKHFLVTIDSKGFSIPNSTPLSSSKSFSDLSKSTANTLRGMIHEIGQLARSELLRVVFPNTNIKSPELETSLLSPITSPRDHRLISETSHFPPSRSSLLQTIDEFAPFIDFNFPPDSPILLSKSLSPPSIFTNPSSFPLPIHLPPPVDSSYNGISDLMGVQGGLKSLTESLQVSLQDLSTRVMEHEAIIKVQIDLLETISHILINNNRNKLEFIHIKGYDLLEQVFTKFPCNCINSQTLLLKGLDILFLSAIDGQSSKLIGNFSSFRCLLKIFTTSHLLIKLSVLKTFRNLLSANPLNSVTFTRFDAFSILFEPFYQAKLMTLDDYQSSYLPYLLPSLDSFLTYLAVLLTHYDHTVPSEYLSLLFECELFYSLRLLLLRSLNRFCQHFASFGIIFNVRLIDVLLFLFRQETRQHFINFDTHPKDIDSIFDLEIEFDSVTLPFFTSHSLPQLNHSNLDSNIALTLILESLCHTIQIDSRFHRKLSSLTRFDVLGGFQLCIDLINPHVPEPIIDLILVFLSHLLCLHDPTHCNPESHWKYYIPLLNKKTFPLRLKLKFLKNIYDTFHLTKEIARSHIHPLEYEKTIKSDFRDSGGLNTLVSILHSSNNNSTHSDNINQENCILATFAFFVFGEAIYNCESSKIFFGDHIGYCEFSDILKKTSIIPDEQFFAVILNLSTSGHFDMLDFVPVIKLWPDYEVSFFSQAITLHQHLSHCNPLFTENPPLSSILSELINHSCNESSQAIIISKPSHHINLVRSKSFSSLSELKTNLNKTDPHGLRLVTNLIYNYRNDNNTFHSNQSHQNILSKVSALIDQTQLSHSKHFTTTKFICTEAALMVILLLPHAKPSVQQNVLKNLVSLCEANPHNKRALCEMQVMSFLLRIYPRFPEEVQSYYLQLITSLGSYDINTKEIRLLYDLATLKAESSEFGNQDSQILRSTEIQMQMLFLLGRIAERVAPSSYFNFDGVVASLRLAPFDRFVSGKYGYSFCCWLKVNNFFENESNLLTWQDHSNTPIIQLNFRLHPTNFDPNSRSLALRSNEGYFILCDKYSFNENGEWHYLVFCHSRTRISIFIDGVLIHESINSLLGYPSNISKSEPLTGLVGCPPPGSSHNTSFCGLLGSLHFFEGQLNQKQISSVFEEGTMFDRAYKTLGIDNKQFFQLHPEDFLTEANLIKNDISSSQKIVLLASPPPNLILSVSRSPPLSPLALGSSTYTSRSSSPISPLNLKDYKEDVFNSPDRHGLSSAGSNTSFVSGCWVYSRCEAIIDVHQTHSIKNEIHKVGGLELCLPLLLMDIAQQIAGLRLLQSLLDQCPNNSRIFFPRGYLLLNYLLSTHETLSPDHFDIIFDIITNRNRFFLHIEATFLVSDLLDSIPLPSRLSVADCLTDIILSNQHNIKFWSQGPGIVTLIDFFYRYPSISSSLLAIIDSLITIAPIEALEFLFSFLTVDHINTIELLQTKEVVSNLLFKTLLQRQDILFSLHHKYSFHRWLILIQSIDESVRVLGLRILCFLFELRNKLLNTFDSLYGWDIVLSFLSDHPTSFLTLDTLLHFALGNFSITIDSNPLKFLSQLNEQKLDCSDKILIHPYIINYLFQLISQTEVESDMSLHLHYISQLDLLCDKPANIEKLLECSWFEQCCHRYLNKVLLQNIPIRIEDKTSINTQINAYPFITCENSPSFERIFDKFRHLVQKIILHDLKRSIKVCTLIKIQDMINVPAFQNFILDMILTIFESNPILPEKDSMNYIRNLGEIFKSIEDIDIPPQFYLRIINNIHRLASQNASNVRTKMKEIGILDLRDQLILQCLYSSESIERLEKLSFSLDTTSANATLRENCLLLLFRLFHQTHSMDLQVFIIDFLRKHLSNENIQYMNERIKDPLISSMLYPEMKQYESLEFESKDSPPHFQPEAFINWYFSESNSEQRQAFISRLDKKIEPLETNLKNIAERQSKKKTLNLQNLEKRLKKKAQISEKTYNQFNEQCHSLRETFKEEFHSIIQKCQEKQSQRRINGENQWKIVENDLKNHCIPFNNEIVHDLKLSEDIPHALYDQVPMDNFEDILGQHIENRAEHTLRKALRLPLPPVILSPVFPPQIPTKYHTSLIICGYQGCQKHLFSLWERVCHLRLDHSCVVENI